MTDEELAVFLCIANESWKDAYIAKMLAEKRALFDRMAGLEMECDLWQAGLGPKPTGVLIDTERSVRHRRAWR